MRQNEMAKTHYNITEKYINLGKKRVSYILANFEHFKRYYFIEQNDDEPMALITFSTRTYLESLSKLQMVYLLDYVKTFGDFTDERVSNLHKEY